MRDMKVHRQDNSDVFEIFPWNRSFETGLKMIDEQHRVLVDILNQLAWHFASGEEVDTDRLLRELVAYAEYHFTCEEAIWHKELGQVDMTHSHHEYHQVFFTKVQQLSQAQGPREEVLAELFRYLTRWLAYHILDSDRRMALTVLAIRDGATLEDASARAETELNGAVSVLVTALLEIYSKLSAGMIQLMREKVARSRAEDELRRMQHERMSQALEEQASEYQQQLETLAYTDPLTGLWNRNGLVRAVRELMEGCDHTGCGLAERSAALVSIDLDDFGRINKRFGEEAADRLLGVLSRRWLDALPVGSSLARLGGDEFALLLPDASHAESRLAALKLTATQPFDMGGDLVTLAFSAGVVLFPDDGAPDADILLRQADNTLYRAKQESKGNWLYLDAGEQNRSRSRQVLLAGIRSALEHNEFRLFYQPKVNLRTNQVVGVEALIRWQHPEQGLLAPLAFLPAIEHHELMIQVGDWVLNEALEQMRLWSSQGIELGVGVNVAAIQLQSPDFTLKLRNTLAAFPDIDPARLDLEILENAALGNLENAISVIRDCQALGVTFSLDDFGTGYSSLSYLKRLPVKTLKVDREFVQGVEGNLESLSILKGIIGLSHVFGKELIAEGMETREQGRILLSLGCDFAQGFGLSPPIPPNELVDWMSNRKHESLLAGSRQVAAE